MYINFLYNSKYVSFHVSAYLKRSISNNQESQYLIKLIQ